MSWLKKLKAFAPDIAMAIASGGATLPALAAKAVGKALGKDIKDQGQLQSEVEAASTEQMLAIARENNAFALEMAKLDVESQRTVNETIRVEAQSDKWWVSGWRPFIGFVTGFTFFVCAVFVCWLVYEAIDSKNADAMDMIPQVIFNFTLLFGIPGSILGIASHHRGKEKRARVPAIR